MKAKLSFLAGAALGFVLGSRAGRENYDRLKASARSVWAHDSVQDTRALVQGFIQAQAGENVNKLLQQILPNGKSKTGAPHAATSPRTGSDERKDLDQPLGDGRLDLAPEASDEFPDEALQGGEGQQWARQRGSMRKRRAQTEL